MTNALFLLVIILFCTRILSTTFSNYGLEHWGSDAQGVSTTRKFLLEWLSFLHRYVPVGIIEHGAPQKMHQRPPNNFFGRDDLETWLSSPDSKEWVRMSAMFLGNVPDDYEFTPKHKSNSYAPETATSHPSDAFLANLAASTTCAAGPSSSCL